MSQNLQILLTLTIIALVPFFILAFTPFIKFIIILSFLRRAVSSPTIPSNQIIIVLAFFLTIIQISPLITTFNSQIISPYLNQKISYPKAYSLAQHTLIQYFKKEADYLLIKMLSPLFSRKHISPKKNFSLWACAFLFNQIKKGLIAGILIYLPFMLIDLILAAILLSLGIFMLSPMFISLPFKIGVFLLLGGWDFFIKQLIFI
jgi:flagellar biosynthetic protein FliP